MLSEPPGVAQGERLAGASRLHLFRPRLFCVAEDVSQPRGGKGAAVPIATMPRLDRALTVKRGDRALCVQANVWQGLCAARPVLLCSEACV